MKLEGEFKIPGSPENAFDFLVDGNRVVHCLPDLQRQEVEDSDHFTVTVRVGVSHMRGPMTMKMEVAEKERPRRARIVGKGSGLGSMVNLDTSFSLEAGDGGGTRVTWEGDARIGGRLSSVAGGLLEPLARKNVERFISAIQAEMARV